MGLNDTASSERVHIGFFGMRNAGKSSIVNAITGQDMAVVSDVKGTTTDPVKKSMELLPLGPVLIIDTPGIDDDGELGELRVKKTQQILAKTDIAVLVSDATREFVALERELITLFEEKKLPYIIVYNKVDLISLKKPIESNEVYTSTVTKENIDVLKEKIGSFAAATNKDKKIVADLLSDNDLVVLVIPIDESTPKSRLILPQQQTIRDILDAHCTVIACQESELKQTLNKLSEKPKMIITDSQVFEKVSREAPDDVLLTSFSILFARYKGELEELVKGAMKLSELKTGDKVLISEGCTHHRQCNDIGTVKLPGWINGFTGAKIEYDFTSGGEFPENLNGYALIVHCGGCMINEQEMKYRICKAQKANVPIVNYGVAIAHMNGILMRSIQAFPDIEKLLSGDMETNKSK